MSERWASKGEGRNKQKWGNVSSKGLTEILWFYSSNSSDVSNYFKK